MIGDVSKSHVSASVDLACRYKNKEVIAFSSFPPHQTCSVSPIFTRYIQQNKTKESANFLTTNLLLPLYGHFLIQSIPNSGYRVLSSDSQKNIGKGENKPLTVKSFIVTSILDNSLFFCPSTKCAKDIIWIYHKINCFFLKTEVSLKRLVGWIEFI